jgi:hypothetical protein
MCSPAGSSVGEQAARQAPALCWMRWSNTSHKRRPSQDKLVHHSDRGSQYLSIKYTERLAEAKIAPSVGSVGDSYPSRACCAYSAGQRTTPWPRRSMACSKPKSFTAVAPSAALKLSNMPRSNGSTTALSKKRLCSTTAVCWNLSGISRQQKLRQTSTPLWKDQTWQHSQDKSASGKPGAVQF